MLVDQLIKFLRSIPTKNITTISQHFVQSIYATIVPWSLALLCQWVPIPSALTLFLICHHKSFLTNIKYSNCFHINALTQTCYICMHGILLVCFSQLSLQYCFHNLNSRGKNIHVAFIDHFTGLLDITSTRHRRTVQLTDVQNVNNGDTLYQRTWGRAVCRELNGFVKTLQFMLSKGTFFFEKRVLID